MVSSLGHDLLQKPPGNITGQQALTVLAEHRHVPHRVIHAQPDKPPEQQVVVELLHEQTFAPDPVEVLQKQGPQESLRSNRRTPRLRVQTTKLPRERPKCLVRYLAHPAQRVVLRHPLCGGDVAKHRLQVVSISSHSLLRARFAPEVNVSTCHIRPFSSAC
jgi:hypothetical protein